MSSTLVESMLLAKANSPSTACRRQSGSREGTAKLAHRMTKQPRSKWRKHASRTRHKHRRNRSGPRVSKSDAKSGHLAEGLMVVIAMARDPVILLV